MTERDPMILLRAAPYEINGRPRQGKMHAIREGERTYCGNEYQYTGGEILEGARGEVTCKQCLRSLDSQDKADRWHAEFEERVSEQQEEERKWWVWYSAYLETPEWAERRRLVLQRARGLCEGCRSAPAAHVHHLTYEHAGDELLFELVALCLACHQKAHPDKEIAPPERA